LVLGFYTIAPPLIREAEQVTRPEAAPVLQRSSTGLRQGCDSEERSL